MNVYACDAVREVRKLYQGAPIASFKSTIELITQHAEILLTAFQSNQAVAKFQISNWHPTLVGKSAKVIFACDFTLEDSKATLAREFGYQNWNDAEARSERLDQGFEQCVDLALAGEVETLKSKLVANPRYANQTSSFGHRATLLLYLAANGVETWRQVVPTNVVEIARLLVGSGADKNAKMNVYGGEFNTIALVESSAHPNAAGVAKELVSYLTA
ncbi:MAG: hypothetical protein AB8B55_09230 [Mariniblastus sp.]